MLEFPPAGFKFWQAKIPSVNVTGILTCWKFDPPG